MNCPVRGWKFALVKGRAEVFELEEGEGEKGRLNSPRADS